MPSRIDPCLAMLVDKPPEGPYWAFEVKWDGYRIGIYKEPGRVRILTWGGYDWTTRFPAIAAEAMVSLQTAILDGEAVVLDEHGRSDFGMLQRALGRRPGLHEPSEIILFAFDLPSVADLFVWRKNVPLGGRRKLNGHHAPGPVVEKYMIGGPFMIFGATKSKLGSLEINW
ncbi:ATP dependent DNA ligase-like protein [Sinorhizobium americanum]|uniref:ATP dependent DNA ligase-like protein n=1 Tax=Sinorhizobium americanum TaxID=194963 RepID=A0A4R2BW26_9HYPH|nr:ATP dependent DNA ligase-like protein [Sinorhizobium americanum]